MADDDKEQAECFNNYFKSVFSEPVDDAPPFPTSCTTLHPLAEVVISPEGILCLLGSPEENKAHGPDCIPNRIMKECSGILSIFLYALYNRSLSSGHLLSEWKRANIAPVYKSGPKDRASIIGQSIFFARHLKSWNT